jgi:hypothetical protein
MTNESHWPIPVDTITVPAPAVVPAPTVDELRDMLRTIYATVSEISPRGVAPTTQDVCAAIRELSLPDCQCSARCQVQTTTDRALQTVLDAIRADRPFFDALDAEVHYAIGRLGRLNTEPDVPYAKFEAVIDDRRLVCEIADEAIAALRLADLYLEGFVWTTEPEFSELERIKAASRSVQEKWEVRYEAGESHSSPSDTSEADQPDRHRPAHSHDQEVNE